MNTIKFHLKPFFLFSLVTISSSLLSGCKRELSREEAEKLIIQKDKLPFDDIREISLFEEKSVDFESTSRDAQYLPAKEGLMLNLENGGFITYSVKSISIEYLHDTYWQEGLGFSAIGWPMDPNKEFVHKFYFRGTYDHIGKLTEKGKLYFVNGRSFKVGKTEFGSVTGIVESNGLNITEVEYTVVYIPNELGRSIFNLQGNTYKRSVSFRKYDDGWRIQ